MRRASIRLPALTAVAALLLAPAGCGTKAMDRGATSSAAKSPASGARAAGARLPSMGSSVDSSVSSISGRADRGGAPVGSLAHGSATDNVVPPASAAGVTWRVPKRWVAQSGRPMRIATYAIAAAPGDAEGAECGVFYFGPHQGGTVDANVARWFGQFMPATHSERSTKHVHGLTVELVRIAGTYAAAAGAMMRPQAGKPDYRLLGAIVTGPQGPVFFKLTGPAKTVAAAGGEFDSLVGSLARE